MAFTIEQPITAINFAIDGVVLANQPFSIDYALAEPSNTETVRGFRIARQSRGRQAVVTWGEDQATPASVAEIRARLGSTLEHLISWIDPDGTVVSIPIIAPAIETEFAYAAPGFYEPMTMRFVERAPRRLHDEGSCNLVFIDDVISGGGAANAEGNIGWDNTDAYFAAYNQSIANTREVYPFDGITIGAPNQSAVSRFVGHPNFSPTDETVLFDANATGTPVALQQTLEAWNYAAGIIGTKIANSSKHQNTAGFVSGLSVSPDGAFVVVGIGQGAGSPPALSNINVWPWDGAVFGTRVDALAGNLPEHTAVDTMTSVDWHPDQNAIAYASNITPYLYIFPWDGAAFGAFINASPIPTVGVLGSYSVKWHPSGNYVAISHDDAPFVTVYPWNGTTLGAAIVPTMIAAGAGRGMAVEWSALGTVLYLAGQTMDSGLEFYAYTFDPVAGTFGARCDPDIPPVTGPSYPTLRRSHNNKWIVIRTLSGGAIITAYSTGLVQV